MSLKHADPQALHFVIQSLRPGITCTASAQWPQYPIAQTLHFWLSASSFYPLSCGVQNGSLQKPPDPLCRPPAPKSNSNYNKKHIIELYFHVKTQTDLEGWIFMSWGHPRSPRSPRSPQSSQSRPQTSLSIPRDLPGALPAPSTAFQNPPGPSWCLQRFRISSTYENRQVSLPTGSHPVDLSQVISAKLSQPSDLIQVISAKWLHSSDLGDLC